MSSEAPERECRALRRLLSAAEGLKADFAADFDAALGPIVAEVLPDSGILLTEVVESFGWDGQRFTLPVSCQAFICRLKALMYDGLELKGRGAFATVYKARFLSWETKLALQHILTFRLSADFLLCWPFTFSLNKLRCSPFFDSKRVTSGPLAYRC